MSIRIDDPIPLEGQLRTEITIFLRHYEKFGGLVKDFDDGLGLTKIEPATPHPKHRILYTAREDDGTLTDLFSCRRAGVRRKIG